MTPALVGIGIALLIGVAWLLFMTRVNSQTVTFQVQVAGTVDEVSFYQMTNPDQPVATITTNGQDTSRAVELAKAGGLVWMVQVEPAQYYFVTKQGEETYQSNIICCEAGQDQTSASLVIRGLKEWEKTEP
jgi:hypothetical protein